MYLVSDSQYMLEFPQWKAGRVLHNERRIRQHCAGTGLSDKGQLLHVQELCRPASVLVA